MIKYIQSKSPIAVYSGSADGSRNSPEGSSHTVLVQRLRLRYQLIKLPIPIMEGTGRNNTTKGSDSSWDLETANPRPRENPSFLTWLHPAHFTHSLFPLSRPIGTEIVPACLMPLSGLSSRFRSMRCTVRRLLYMKVCNMYDTHRGQVFFFTVGRST